MSEIVEDRRPVEELIPVERVELYRDGSTKPSDQLSRWRTWLETGVRDLGERGKPPSGYFRRKYRLRDKIGFGFEAFCVYLEDNQYHCIRNVFGDGSKMDAAEIDEMFADRSVEPITYEAYTAVAENGEAWPDHVRPDWPEEVAARARTNPERFDENGRERPGIGHNNPPEELPPDHALAKRIHDLGVQLKAWLDKIGGTPKTQAEAEILAGYANKFKDFENEAVAAHKAEKQPFLDGGRAVDAKWFGPVRDKASASRAKIVTIIRAFEDAENARLAEEARIANEAARKSAEASARIIDEVPASAPEIVPEKAKVSTLRGGTRKVEPVITDLKAFLIYCASLNTIPPDIAEAAEKVARKFRAAGVKAPGMTVYEKENVA